MCSAGGGNNTSGEEAGARAGGNEEEAEGGGGGGGEEEGREEMREVEGVAMGEDDRKKDNCALNECVDSVRDDDMCCQEENSDNERREEEQDKSEGEGTQGQGLRPEEYPRLAREGIQLMLNNRFTEAEEMFRTHTNDSIHMAMGYCYLTFMNAVMSFEEEKVSHSMDTLRNMERRCGGGGGGGGGDGGNGWFSSVKNIVMGSLSSSSPASRDQNEEPGSQLEQQVALADCQVLLAILTFLQQELGSYVRGGWTLRKAWKVYEHAYTKVKRLYRQTFNGTGEALGQDRPLSPSSEHSQSLHGSRDELKSPGSWSMGAEGVPGPSPEPPAPAPPPTSRMPLSKSVPNLKGFLLNSNHKNHQPKKPLPPDLVSRLMASVSFGYGLFQLCTSLLPPSLLRVVSVLGLQGDRLAGLSALMFARRSHDMRAPLATLTLLWYHTVVRPFFALDGSKVRAGVEAAHLLLQEAQSTYAQSALFLFFRGRVHRLQGDVSGALGSYRGALQVSPQRELQLLALHEVAWCHLLQLNWTQAQAAFASLKKESRWSKSFYAYVSAVCLGASGRSDECVKRMREVPSLVRRSSHALEAFLLRRALKEWLTSPILEVHTLGHWGYWNVTVAGEDAEAFLPSLALVILSRRLSSQEVEAL
ncbi:hypothetical protein Pcinc_008916 [Petrolisthes cinctipes]|uniref:Tetratricopeptide repeat domain 39C n=1 Tax=Petrolisthes cinctipes TaxID=88211 RepID=A0AAE1KWS8_PETCI|nr:hypothetical protein Pcinc_008916 [Petrolisthes cinctipes]